MVQAIFLTTVLGGTACLVAAITVARFNWRSDVPPFIQVSSAFKVLARPSSYVVAPTVPLVRALTLIGYGLLGIAFICLAYQLFTDLSK